VGGAVCEPQPAEGQGIRRNYFGKLTFLLDFFKKVCYNIYRKIKEFWQAGKTCQFPGRAQLFPVENLLKNY
jgi:TRAP-type mannitol/chloroaromatic compound transport system permease small subunit